MSPRDKSIQALSRAASGFSQTDTICLSCRRTLQLKHQTQRRRYASAAAAAVAELSDASQSTPSSSNHNGPKTKTPAIRPAYQMHAGILLSRPPILTRELTPFENAFYLYQRRLNERLALPFTRYFYIKKGTPADVEWKRKMRERLTPARDIGVYHAYGKEAWNDELLLGDETSEPQRQVEALLQDAESAESVAEQGLGEAPDIGGDARTDKAKAELMVQQAAGKKDADAVERPVSRVTEADRTGDERSLNRLGWRSLYLLVKGENGRWRFPSSTLARKESFHQAAERTIVQTGGPNMNTWVVGGAPVAHYAGNFAKPVQNDENGTYELGEKIFFLKGRIMAGQPTLKDNKLGLSDFKWLAKEEIKSHVDERYYSMVENMLAER